MALNLNKLFVRALEPSFLGNLKPEPDGEAVLRDAKAQIQQHLKIAIPQWLEEKLGEKPKHPPRFRTQGSWAYKTCNDPCQCPPQEMDWDLGIYLPVSLWEDNGVQPRRAATAFYEMVKDVMTPLAEANGWSLKEKPTCIRVILGNGSRAHIDLPLYAAPDPEFVQIKEAVAKAYQFTEARASAAPDVTWDSLTRIALARQDGTWDPSDPGRVVKWFDKKLERHGEQLRRVCRYLKGWRDYVWESGGPSSIVLMVCAAQTLDRADTEFTGRDDMALRHVLTALPAQLRVAVKEPMIDPNEDLNRLDEEQRYAAAVRASEFLNALNRALTATAEERTRAIELVRQHLGLRFPNDPNGVSPDNGPTVNIRTIPPAATPRPMIVPTKAG